MTEKAALFKRETDFSHWGVFLKENAVWAVLGLGAELGSSGLSAAPTAGALVAGLSGKRSLCAAFGGALGAVLHGFPSALLGLAAMGIVLAARFIPDLNNTKLRFFAAAFAVFFARIAEVGDTSELLITIVAALVSGLLALCICLLCDISRTRDPDISEPRDCSLCCIVTALGFLSLGALDYPFANRQADTRICFAHCYRKARAGLVRSYRRARGTRILRERHGGRCGCYRVFGSS